MIRLRRSAYRDDPPAAPADQPAEPAEPDPAAPPAAPTIEDLADRLAAVEAVAQRAGDEIRDASAAAAVAAAGDDPAPVAAAMARRAAASARRDAALAEAAELGRQFEELAGRLVAAIDEDAGGRVLRLVEGRHAALRAAVEATDALERAVGEIESASSTLAALERAARERWGELAGRVRPRGVPGLATAFVLPALDVAGLAARLDALGRRLRAVR